jgi:hypothetical protein
LFEVTEGTLGRIAGIWAKNQTWDLPDMQQECNAFDMADAAMTRFFA